MMLINLIKGNFRHLSKSLGCPKPDYDVNLNIGGYYMQLGTRNMKHRKIGKQIILTFNQLVPTYLGRRLVYSILPVLHSLLSNILLYLGTQQLARYTDAWE